MPRPRRYVSTTVPAIGCDMANRRRADSGDPVGAGDRRGRLSDSGSDRGRLRKRRASSATSWKSTRPQLSRMTSSRSPCSPVAASVHLPAGRPPDVRAFQADEHRAAGRVPDVADQPVVADATSVGEIVTAHRLGLAREAMCQLCRIARHVTPPPDRRCAQSDSAPEPWRGSQDRSHRPGQRNAASTK